ncbi:hypothetical protein R8Z57_12075 [Microbacterium sp. M3]|uniref:Uncharacterized protein n=1 Tax=Microbacterium arthrosphaerae TaxID=792652 RepID=A0ABU4H2F5_9MICO|nr:MULTISPECIES: hypothetical protein [Microbacterium]MDW4573511.1 hypothetical protein [Microbacterium arthrosphaerae]MDW7607366.1 hypothetical protein [Microbacterium sp. M3]
MTRWVQEVASLVHAMMTLPAGAWLEVDSHRLRVVSDVELQHEVSHSEGVFTVSRVERGNVSPLFRSNDQRAIVARLALLGRFPDSVRGCVYRRPPGFSTTQDAGEPAFFRWGEDQWAAALAQDSSLELGLVWAWVFAAEDSRIRTWTSPSRDGTLLWPDSAGERCALPAELAYGMTVDAWEAWLMEHPELDGGRTCCP